MACVSAPAVRALTRYAGLSERRVRACLGRLEAGSLDQPCDPAVVAARIKRVGRQPKGWDLNLSLVRDAADLPSVVLPGSRDADER